MDLPENRRKLRTLGRDSRQGRFRQLRPFLGVADSICFFFFFSEETSFCLKPKRTSGHLQDPPKTWTHPNGFVSKGTLVLVCGLVPVVQRTQNRKQSKVHGRQQNASAVTIADRSSQARRRGRALHPWVLASLPASERASV